MADASSSGTTEPAPVSDTRTRIVIIGAGVAGLHIAQTLHKKKDLRVTLIAPTEAFVFLPRLTELFSKQIRDEQARFPLNETWKGDFVAERATIVNPQEKHVVCASGKQVPYDYLIIAAGSTVNYFNTPGSEYCYPFYSETDMIRLREHVAGLLEADEQPGTRTFAIVGGGPTGCEVAYALSTVLAKKKATGKIVLIDRAPSVLGPFPQTLREGVTVALEKQGVTILPNTAIVSISPLSLELQQLDGTKESMPCLTTIWAAGSKPQNLAISGIEKTPKGEIPVTPTLQLPGFPTVFVAGDIAAAGCPKTAQAAVQQATLVADNVSALLKHKEPQPFVFKDKGVIIAMDQNTVGLFFGKLVSGFIAQQVRDKYYRFQLGNYK